MSKNLEEYTKEELLAYISELKKGRRFGLVWEPKEEQVVKDCETRVPLLKEVEDRAIKKTTDNDLTNLLIEGDNFHSLTTLNYTHAGKIDVIYIDPPYNTGARDWRYNNDYVDSTDNYRHSKWLSLMDNRLRLTRNLLKPTGIIVVTIDDYEIAPLRLLMDDIFGNENHLGTAVIRNNPSGRSTVKGFSINHEYALFYQKTDLATLGRLPHSDVQRGRYNMQDDYGFFEWENFRKNGTDSDRSERPKQFYPIIVNKKTLKLRVPNITWNDSQKSYDMHETPSDDEEVLWPTRNGLEKVWKFGLERLSANLDEMLVKSTKNGYEIYRKKYLNDVGSLPRTWWDKPSYSARDNGTRKLAEVLGAKNKFDFPKAPEAVRDCLSVANLPKDGIVLDFFAGSGTTGHAVLELNAQDGGNRQFILCTNNENGIAEEVTYERINNVINGYNSTTGIPANLRYFKTDFVDTNGLSTLTDKDKLEITKEMGAMIALRENSFNQLEQTDYWQTYENSTQLTAIYFREDKTHMQEYLDKLNAQDKPVKLYVFGWGKNAGSEYASKKISVEDIPEPLIEVYKEIAK